MVKKKESQAQCGYIAGRVFAQGIYGRVLDEKKQPIINGVIQVYQGGSFRGGAVTDYDGNYEVKPLEPGYYLMVVTYLSYDTERIKDVIVPPNDETKVDFTLKQHSTILTEHVVKAYKKPLVGNTDTHIQTAEELKVLPGTQIADAAAMSAGAYQQKRGEEISIGGGRVEGTLYIIDGVQVQYIAGNRSGVDMSQGSVEELEVSTSGIEAKYGDVSGGVISITTRGVSQKFNGEVRGEHSLDGYNNNMLNFSMAGPIWRKHPKGDTTQPKKPVMGFALSGDYFYNPDRYPSYVQQQNLRGSVLQSILNNPLIETTDNTGAKKFFYASNYITQNDLVTVKVPPGNLLKEYTLNGKLDFQPAENIHVVGGVNVDYVQQPLYNDISQAQIQDNLFAPQSNPTQNNFSGRGFIRMTQKFAKANDSSHSIISNAYYTVQLDFQRETTENINKSLGKNFFEYGYIGKFTDYTHRLYKILQKEDSSGRTGTILVGTQDDGYTFQPNPSSGSKYLANYTSELFNLTGNEPLVWQTIRAEGGLLNGDNPASTYSIKGVNLFTSPGSFYGGYSISRYDQYGLSVDASLDLKTGKIRHAIQFGLYYQQRVTAAYSVATGSLWNLLRNGAVANTANGGLYLDKTHPIFVVNGKKYSLSDIRQGKVLWNSSDTIIYQYANKKNSPFDSSLRKKLGLSDTADINIDALDPAILNLGMFSADQVLNSGNQIASYMGYTYSGAPQTGTVNFNDFWTKKDANGNFSRPIGAFTPNYIAGYIQDKFRYENIKFSLGVRIERYSSNTKVLMDPYSEYPEANVNEVSGSYNTLNGNQHPNNMKGNYVVYVDNNSSSNPTIVGYRNGNNWYDPKGNLVADPTILQQYSQGRAPQPYILPTYRNIKISDSNYNPNLTFTDYTPQVAILPRIKLSFPISEEADFFAHYDIYSQRPYPNSIAWSTPATYYFLSENAQQIVPNANLLPSQTFDYEAGFQQKLTDHSAMTITGFYKERKNQVDVVPYVDAWPTTYYTYGNKDFSTSKGSTINFDFRTTNNLRMNISYTLQFAEGTGSTYNSSNGGSNGQAGGLLASLLQAGQPNLRYVIPLSYDSRHNFSFNVDYRFKDSEGPMLFGKYIFENAGVDVVATARSGEPFTRYTVPDNLAHTLIGGVNGSRLPWHFGVNLKLDKQFRVNYMAKNTSDPKGDKIRKSKYFSAYLSVLNLFNIKDILGVYGYTGKPNDDGYLASSYGQQYVPQQVSPKSFTTLYSLYVNNPGNYNYARTVNLGVIYNF